MRVPNVMLTSAIKRFMDRQSLNALLSDLRTDLEKATREEFPDSIIVDIDHVLTHWTDISHTLVLCLQYPVIVFYEFPKKGLNKGCRGARYDTAGNNHISFPHKKEEDRET